MYGAVTRVLQLGFIHCPTYELLVTNLCINYVARCLICVIFCKHCSNGP